MTSLFSGFSSHVPPHPRLLSQWFFPPQLPSHHTHLGWLCPPHGFQWCCLLAFFFLCSPPIHLILSTWVSNKAFKLCPKHNFTFIPSSDLLLLYEWQLFFFFFFPAEPSESCLESSFFSHFSNSKLYQFYLFFSLFISSNFLYSFTLRPE